jgi:hypothetical protein
VASLEGEKKTQKRNHENKPQKKQLRRGKEREKKNEQKYFSFSYRVSNSVLEVAFSACTRFASSEFFSRIASRATGMYVLQRRART